MRLWSEVFTPTSLLMARFAPPTTSQRALTRTPKKKRKTLPPEDKDEKGAQRARVACEATRRSTQRLD